MGKKNAVIILAAGKGTRMNSETAKVLHCIHNKPMIQYVVETAAQLAGDNVVVVVGTQAEKVMAVVSAVNPGVQFARQENQLGTGHAVLCAIPELSENIECVIILCGDVPFMKASTLTDLADTHRKQNNAITIVGATLDNPTGYGRLVTNEANRVRCIVEEADATATEKPIKLINTGIYCVDRNLLERMLIQIKPNNAQNEMYLTDIVGIATKNEWTVGMVTCDDRNEILGINTLQDLQKAEAVISSEEKP